MQIVECKVESFSTEPFKMSTEQEQQASYERYYSRVFSVRDAFVTPKRFHDWHRAGLLPLDMPQGRKNLMSLPEFIWVRLINSLRRVGTAQEHIRPLGEFLFSEVNVGELAAEGLQSTAARTALGRMLDRSDVKGEHRQAVQDELESDVPFSSLAGARKMTVLDSLLFHLLTSKDEVGVQLLPSGHFALWAESMGEPRMVSTHVYLSITEQMEVFRSSLLWEKKTQRLDELSPQEWQVIWAIRDRRAKEVTVNFLEKGGQRQIDICTTRQEQLDPKVEEAIVELVKMGKYTDISIKTQGGEKLFLQRTKRRRV